LSLISGFQFISGISSIQDTIFLSFSPSLYQKNMDDGFGACGGEKSRFDTGCLRAKPAVVHVWVKHTLFKERGFRCFDQPLLNGLSEFTGFVVLIQRCGYPQESKTPVLGILI
jgi:hypothetical protein